MAWKSLFERKDLIEIMAERGYVFIVEEGLEPLVRKVKGRRGWKKNREERQKILLKLIKRRPKIFNFIYKFLNFILDDRRYFRIKCVKGADDHEALQWEFNHRSDILRDILKTIKRHRIKPEEIVKILRLFFLAAPELFIKDRIRKEDGGKTGRGRNFYISPKSEDSLYFLSSTKKELEAMYNSLKSNSKKNSFLSGWLELLEIKGYY